MSSSSGTLWTLSIANWACTVLRAFCASTGPELATTHATAINGFRVLRFRSWRRNSKAAKSRSIHKQFSNQARWNAGKVRTSSGAAAVGCHAVADRQKLTLSSRVRDGGHAGRGDEIHPPLPASVREGWSGARVEKDRSVRPLGRAREVRPWSLRSAALRSHGKPGRDDKAMFPSVIVS